MSLHGKTKNLSLKTSFISTFTILLLVLWSKSFVQVLPDGKVFYGLFSLIPIACVLVFALLSKRTLEPLFVGVCAGLLMIDASPFAFLKGLMNSSLKVMANPVMGWIILLSALMGGLIFWLQKSNATVAFSQLLGKFVKTRSQSIIAAWLLGLVIFIDDYLSALTVGASMRRLTDKFKVSRAMLAYVAAATAAPVCLLVPISTWAIYVSGLLESSNVAPKGEGLSFYASIIPYIFYAWVAVLLVPLVAWKIIGPSAAMQKSEHNAQNTVQALVTDMQSTSDELESAQNTPHLWNFFLPIIIMIAATWYMGDTLLGVISASLFTLFLYRLQSLGSIEELCNQFMDGVTSMILPIAIIFAAFLLQEINEQLGLAAFLIDGIKPYLSGVWLPAMTFVLLSILTFTTGSFWGIYAIAMPIIVPLAIALDANIPLTLGALISAGGFGSHACFFGDATVLASKSCEITPMEHALTQFRYALISASIALLLFIILGLM